MDSFVCFCRSVILWELRLLSSGCFSFRLSAFSLLVSMNSFGLPPKEWEASYSASAGHLNNNLYLWLMAMEISFWIGREGRNLTRISSRPLSHGETFMGAFKMTIIFLSWVSDQFYLLDPNIVLDGLYALVYFFECFLF